jgi:hypothetical protein
VGRRFSRVLLIRSGCWLLATGYWLPAAHISPHQAHPRPALVPDICVHAHPDAAPTALDPASALLATLTLSLCRPSAASDLSSAALRRRQTQPCPSTRCSAATLPVLSGAALTERRTASHRIAALSTRPLALHPTTSSRCGRSCLRALPTSLPAASSHSHPRPRPRPRPRASPPSHCDFPKHTPGPHSVRLLPEACNLSTPAVSGSPGPPSTSPFQITSQITRRRSVSSACTSPRTLRVRIACSATPIALLPRLGTADRRSSELRRRRSLLATDPPYYPTPRPRTLLHTTHRDTATLPILRLATTHPPLCAGGSTDAQDQSRLVAAA